MKKEKIIALAVTFAVILQMLTVSGNTVFAQEILTDCDFETVINNIPSGWETENAVISSDNNYWYSGSRSMKIEKTSPDEAVVFSDALIPVDKQGITGDITLLFGLMYKAKNCNVFMRLDAVIYDSNKNPIDTLCGNTVMLPRSQMLCEWRELSTEKKVPERTEYISYKIVITGVDSVAVGDKATVYADDITCKVVKTYIECISDYCDFHALSESGTVAGFSTSDGLFTTADGVGIFKGNSADSRLSYKTEKLSPECGYEINAKYTATDDCTAEISYYGINDDIIKTDKVTLKGTGDVSALSLKTDVPDAVYAVFSIAGSTSLTLDDLYFFKVSTRQSDGLSGWTADSLWYPEDAAVDAYYQFRYFRVTFQLESGVSDAYVQMAFDDSVYNLYVNGSFVSTTPEKTVSQDGKKSVYIYNIGSKLTSGKNVIAVKVLNCGMSAGFILESFIHLTNSSTYHLTANPLNTKVSRLNCTSSHENDYASFTDSPSSWKNKSYNDSEWKTPVKQGIPPYSNMGSGDISFAYEYSDYFCFLPSSCPNVTSTGGEQKTTSISFTSFKNSKIPETVTGLLLSGDTVKAHIPMLISQCGNRVDFTYELPDYLPAGSYSVKPVGIGLLGNSSVLFNVTLNQTEKTNPHVSTVKEQGSIKLKVNGATVSPVMYMRPANSSVYYNYSAMQGMKESGIPIYCTFNGSFDGSDGSPIWVNENQIDYNAFDNEIYKTLDLNKNAYLIVNLSLDAPDWWLDANPDQCQRDTNGNSIGKVSFASVEYRNDACRVTELLIRHMESSAYSHKVIGVKLSAGKTNEWMNYLRNDDDTRFYSVDYSVPMQTAFKNATGYDIPTVNERASGSGTLVLDQSTQANVIAYNKFLSQCVTDSFLCYAQTVKKTASNIIAGGYNGYLWFENSSLGIGTSHTTVEQVLSSDYVDFVSSPVNYSERINGFATGYMALTDSVAAHGKLYIAEQDNRTLYGHIFGNAGQDDLVGLSKTLSGSVNQITRDLSTNLVSGNGFWLYDMEGGWFNDAQLNSAVKAIKNEYDYSASLNMASNSEVAVFVGADTYDYLNSDIYLSDTGSRSTRLLSQLYTAQRLELSKMGTSYDTFAVSDLTSEKADVDWSQYKLIIMLSPFNVSAEERTAIENKLKTDNRYILWVYLPGISNGSVSSASNISSLVDMSVSVNNGSNNTLCAEITDYDYPSGFFGSNVAYNTPRANIINGYTGVIAKYPGSISFLRENAMAYKTLQNYTSVYSAVPGVPADVLRKLCELSGVHIYSNDADTSVQTNNSYISINSAYSGTQTVSLDKNYRIFDVFNNCVIADNSDTIEVTLNVGETKLYRLEKAVLPRNYDGGILTNGDFYLKTSDGYTGWTLGEVPVYDENSVINGDFENAEPFYAWQISATGGATVEAVGEDNTAVKIKLLSASDQGYIQGYQFSVKPLTEYTVSYRLKIEPNYSGGNGAQCYSFFYEFDNSGAPSGGLIAESGRWNTQKGDWETVSFNIVTGANTKTARIDLMHNGVAGISYWDDVNCVAKNGVENTACLTNSSLMENGVALSGNGCYICCSTLMSQSKASYMLAFDGLMEGTGKAEVTVYDPDNNAELIKTELRMTDMAAHYKIAVPSPDAKVLCLKFSLKDAKSNSALHICNITMRINYGDFDNSGLASAGDLIIMQKALVGKAEVNEFFDLNGDGLYNIKDLVRLKKYTVMV